MKSIGALPAVATCGVAFNWFVSCEKAECLLQVRILIFFFAGGFVFPIFDVCGLVSFKIVRRLYLFVSSKIVSGGRPTRIGLFPFLRVLRWGNGTERA